MNPDNSLLCQYRGRSIQLDPRRRSSIGTDPSCDVVLEGLDGIRQWWAVVRMITGWYVEPVNGIEVAVGDGPWSDRLAWLKEDGPVSVRLRCNGTETSVRVSQIPVRQDPPVPAGPGTTGVSYARAPASAPPPPAPLPPAAPPSAPPIPIPDTPVGQWFTIGRENGPADVKLPGPDVALVHARARRQSDGSVDIRDQSLGLGILVNGRPVLSARIPPGGSFIIGHHRLVAGHSQVTVGTVRRSPVLACRDLVVTYQRDKDPRLVGINFVLNTHEFMTVIGPSSAGKSTLFRALLGEVENVRGSVQFSWGALTADGPPGGLVSFVPQDDHLPGDLTIRQAIRFAARLRLAPDLPRRELNQRTDQVMARLDLTKNAETDVGKASGGTRKRVSLALELLSDPVLLILDEPTSGLDEGLDRRLMRQLADLAREGTAILLVTHSMANLDESDRVLAINGRKTAGYCGPPQAMKHAFGTHSYADVMDKLRDGTSVISSQPAVPATAAIKDSRTFLQRARRRQIPVLARRELRRFVPSSEREPGRLPSRSYLGHLLAKPALHLLVAPLVVALLSCLVGSRGLATSRAIPNAQLAEPCRSCPSPPRSSPPR